MTIQKSIKALVPVNIICEADCERCGEILYLSSSAANGQDEITITVSPCQTCLDEARDEGYREGFDTAKE